MAHFQTFDYPEKRTKDQHSSLLPPQRRRRKKSFMKSPPALQVVAVVPRSARPEEPIDSFEKLFSCH
jgi:hypothetical protein